MGEYYAQDIRDDIIDILTNGRTVGSDTYLSLSAQLALIDASRTQTTPTPNLITYKWGHNQMPLVLVDSESSEIINDEILSADLSVVPQIFIFDIHIQIKSPNEQLHNYIENYIEAITKILQGYCYSNITWMLVTNTEKSEIYIDQNQRFKMATVKLSVRIN